MGNEDSDIETLKRRVTALELQVKAVKPVMLDVKTALMGESANTTEHISKIYDRLLVLEHDVTKIKIMQRDLKKFFADLNDDFIEQIVAIYGYLERLFDRTKPLLKESEITKPDETAPIVKEIQSGIVNFLEERARRRKDGAKKPPKSTG